MSSSTLKIDYFSEKDIPVGAGAKWVINRHLSTLVKNILRDLKEFSLKSNLKEKSLC